MPARLLDDTLTFLAFLHANPVRPRGHRWLPPSALAMLNAQLHVRDQIALPSRPEGGRLGTVERGTQRIRFIHFLCEAAHLVARTGSYLKPTLRVKSWLTAEPFEQLQQLFVAAYPDQPSRPHDELWRIYRLPGWSLTSPTVALIQPLLQLLRVAPPDEKIKLTTLLKLIPLPEDGAETPEDVLHGLLDHLATIGALDWRGSAIMLTAVGASLITPGSPAPALSVQPSATLQLTRQRYPLVRADFTTLYELGDYAELIAVKSPRPTGVERRYRLDRSLVQRALQRGHSLDAILRFLENTIGDALPPRLVQQLHDWAAPLDRVAVRRVTLLEVKDPATLTDLTRSHRVRESIQRTLSPRAVVIRETRLPALLRQLAKHGLTPRTNLPIVIARSAYPPRAVQRGQRRSNLSGLAGDCFAQNARSDARFDSPVLAQLYFAALLNQQLSDRLPAPYRVDYSIALDLARQLTPRDQLLAAELAQEAVEMLKSEVGMRNDTTQSAESDSAFRLPHSELESILALIEQSIAAHTPLVMRYYTAGRDAQTDRVVDPLRLEWRTGTPYLIAYCRLRQDERIFRIDRIVEISQAE